MITIETLNENSQIGQIKKAVRLAKKFHAGQVRKGPNGDAFYSHPRRVCKSYLIFENKSISGLIAALCHDLVEDTPMSLVNLEEMFGTEVRKIVFDLTKAPNISSEEYAKSIHDWHLESKKIKLCDIEDNILDSREIPLEQRLRMLVRWKKYLDRLEHDSSPGEFGKKNEFFEKWNTVNKLHAEEMDCLKPGINLLRKS